MHRWRDTEGCDGRRWRLVRLMWPMAHVEAEAPPSPATATSSSRFTVLPPPTTFYQLAAVAAQEQECVDSPRPVSPGSFIKNGREIQVGACALFQIVDVPPFIGLIRWIEKKEEGYPKLRVSWLYRPADIKLNKGIQLNAAPNEIFYSFHQETRHLLFPCCTLAKLPFYVKVLSSRLEFLHLYVGVYTILTTSVYGGLPTEIILMNAWKK